MSDLLQSHLFVVLLLLGIPFVLVLWVVPLWFVCKKAGLSPWLTLLNCIPLGTTVLLYLLAFADWKSNKAQAPQSQRLRGPQLVVR